MGVKELLRALGLHPGQQSELKRALRDLARRGEIEQDGNRFLIPQQLRGQSRGGESRHAGGNKPGASSQERGPKKPTVTGTLKVNAEGFGFVQTPGPNSKGIFIPPDEVARALDNDRVEVTLEPGRGGRPMGRLVRVVDRPREWVVGTYFERGSSAWVAPRDATLGPISVPKTQLARPGDAVKVRLGIGRKLLTQQSGLTGEVSGSLGNDDDRSIEVLSIAYAQGFHDEFPAAVMDEADAFESELSEGELEGRRDLRSMPLVTIDGEDARDFDDAIYVEDKADGWRLVVAIADVANYVREGQPLDDEALRRATSVYLPGRVLPMLPERLSNGLCSLKPDEDRLCMVADMQIDRRGVTTGCDVYPAVMRSQARCTYEEVHAVLSGQDVPHRNRFKGAFERALKLSQTLRQMRRERGAIEFDLPETRVELDGEGQPLRMVRRERLESHRLIEECMLAANEAVARYFKTRKLPTVNRFHGAPDEDKLALFSTLAGTYGFSLPSEPTGNDLNALLAQLEGHKEQRGLNQLLLRSMMQAVYSSEQTGHFGLGATDYLHFTSPIRRYPDLLVHRLLKALWKRGEKKPSQAERDEETEKLEALSVQSSERERAAMQVEREVVSFYQCLLMQDRVGEAFDGVVSGLSESGFFVELKGVFIEGMVRAETVSHSAELDTSTGTLLFGGGESVRVGQDVKVKVSAVNLQRKRIDLELTEALKRGGAPAGVRMPGEGGREQGYQRRSGAPPQWARLKAKQGGQRGGGSQQKDRHGGSKQKSGGKPGGKGGRSGGGGKGRGGRR